MQLKGFDARRSNTLGFRNSDPERDFDLRGDPVESNYVAFVRLKDCRHYKDGGRNYYDPKNAPSIPVNHGGTWYGYGPQELKKDGKRFGQRWTWVYWSYRVYFAHKGYVYTARGYRDSIPDGWGNVVISNGPELAQWLKPFQKLVAESQDSGTIVGKAEHIKNRIEQLEAGQEVLSWQAAKTIAYWLLESTRKYRDHKVCETARWLIAEAEQQKFDLYAQHDKSWPIGYDYGRLT